MTSLSNDSEIIEMDNIPSVDEDKKSELLKKRSDYRKQLGDRRLSFILSPLDILRLRPFIRLVEAKARRRRQKGTILPFSKAKIIWNLIYYLFFLSNISLTITFSILS